MRWKHLGLAVPIALTCTVGAALAQSGSPQLKSPSGGGTEYPACCKHCSEITCSGCGDVGSWSSTQHCQKLNRVAATCVTKDDVQTCAPAR